MQATTKHTEMDLIRNGFLTLKACMQAKCFPSSVKMEIEKEKKNSLCTLIQLTWEDIPLHAMRLNCNIYLGINQSKHTFVRENNETQELNRYDSLFHG